MCAPVAVSLDHETEACWSELAELEKVECEDGRGGTSGRPPVRSEKIRSRESWPAVRKQASRIVISQ